MLTKIKKLIRGLIKIIAIIIAVIVIIGYIPIKFAKHTKNLVLNDNEYFFQVELKSGIEENWSVFDSLPIYYSEKIFVNVSGNIPFNTLNPKYFYLHSNKENQFIATGELIYSGTEATLKTGTFEIKSWDIVYPIKRDAYWLEFLPKGYLTIYDFNWCAYFKNLFNRK